MPELAYHITYRLAHVLFDLDLTLSLSFPHIPILQQATSLLLTTAGYQAWANCLSPYIQHALLSAR